MNNYVQIRLTHRLNILNVGATFTDGNGETRYHYNVTPSSVERLQNAIVRENRRANTFEIRLPNKYDVVGWVADRR